MIHNLHKNEQKPHQKTFTILLPQFYIKVSVKNLQTHLFGFAMNIHDIEPHLKVWELFQFFVDFVVILPMSNGELPAKHLDHFALK